MAKEIENNEALEVGSRHGEAGEAYIIPWVMRRLGYPRTRVELTEDQIRDNFRLALVKYVSKSERPTKYWQQMTRKYVNTYNLPEDFMYLAADPFYIANPIMNMIQTFTSYMMYLNFTGNLDVTNYHMLMEHYQLKLNQIAATPTFEVIYGPPRLKVYPSPADDNLPIVYSYVALPRAEDWSPQYDPIGWDWTLRYTLALSKEILGRIRGKFGDQLVAGDNPVSLDGAILLGEAKEEKTALEAELDSIRACMPIMLF